MELVNPSIPDPNPSATSSANPSPRELAQKVWTEALTIMKTRLSNHTYSAWFLPIQPLHFEGRKLQLQIPSQFFYDWIEEHHYSLLVEALTQATSFEVTIEYSIKPEERALYPDENQI